MTENKKTFSEELAQLLTGAGLSKAEAARLLGVPRKTFSQWVLGDHMPPEFVQKVTLEELRRAIQERKTKE